MMLVGMYPTQWDLPKRDKEELRMLLGMSAMEWEKRAGVERERLAEAEQARLRHSDLSAGESAGESRQVRPKASSVRRLVAALR